MTLPAGTRVGPYEILAAIGAGDTVEVYRARDVKLGRDVAIKVLPAAFTIDADRVSRFEREARVLASLTHPHIAAIFGFKHTGDVQGLVLELIEGPTLAERLMTGALPPAEALTLARQIADALDTAHEKGIVHRDLKPVNIKIAPGGVVKVLDFGLAKIDGGELGGQDMSQSPTVTIGGTREGMILGTAPYMSPEQAHGKPLDKRTDIWSFGCVLYEMLTGRLAFAGETVFDTIAVILGREPDWTALPAAVPPTVRRLLQRCLEKDPRQRRRDIGDVRHELDHALSEVRGQRPGAVAGPETARGTAWRSWRRIAAAAAVVVAVSAAAIFIARQVGPASAPVPLEPPVQLTDFDDAEAGRPRFPQTVAC